MKVPSLTYDYSQDGIVIAVQAELIVRSEPIGRLRASQRAEEVADPVGSLAEI